MPISEAYMTPNLRWGFYVLDHPGAPEPTYTLLTPEEAGVPAAFCRDETGGPVEAFVRCTLKDAAGNIVATGDREIPTNEKRRTGKMAPFARTAENWRKLRTMALGRALKAAGYPDTTDDLKAFLLYRQRLLEFGVLPSPTAPALSQGVPAPALSTGDVSTQAEAEIAEGTVEGTSVAAEDAEDDVVVDVDTGEILAAEAEESDVERALAEGDLDAGADGVAEEGGEGEVAWPPEIVALVRQLSDEKYADLERWLTAAGITPQILIDRPSALKQVERKIASLQAEA